MTNNRLSKDGLYILGAGITGLSAAEKLKVPVFESEALPGGICLSYYLLPGSRKRVHAVLPGKGYYRFEIGGGHWIFGADYKTSCFMRRFCTLGHYNRKSSVFFERDKLCVPYPLQNNLRFLNNSIIKKVLSEIGKAAKGKKISTMQEFLFNNFGATLCRIFFFPFHNLYTAGMFRRIAYQDAFKTPVDRNLIIRGVKDKTPAVGYNAKFVYPSEGLGKLIFALARRCDIRYKKQVVRIDVNKKRVYFSDGTSCAYNFLISTIPLNKMIEMCSLHLSDRPNPYTSVLVLNIGAVKGPFCPDEHWLYIPRSNCGFHRVGFYSNVEGSFLGGKKAPERVSIYVERTYLAGDKPGIKEINSFAADVVKELRRLGFIKEVEVLDKTWIDVAYTWSWPGSRWREKAIKALEKNNIFQIGRFGRWKFQGIAESIEDGLSIKAE